MLALLLAGVVMLVGGLTHWVRCSARLRRSRAVRERSRRFWLKVK